MSRSRWSRTPANIRGFVSSGEATRAGFVLPPPGSIPPRRRVGVWVKVSPEEKSGDSRRALVEGIM